MIALLTVPNTGTHTILNLLKLSDDITEHISAPSACWGIGRIERDRYTLEYKNVDSYDNVIYQRHILGRDTHCIMDLICMGHKTVIPMRDPLASLITRKHRNPSQPMYEHIDAFEYIATSPWIKNSFIFPIDTKRYISNWTFREYMARSLFAYLELDFPKQTSQWAKDNEIRNCGGFYPEKRAYEYNDLAEATRGCIGEFEYLKSKRDVIIPFMKSLGYDDKFWWNE